MLVSPVAEHVTGAINNALGGSLPEEAQGMMQGLEQMMGPLAGMLGKLGGTMFGTQLGQALGGLSGEVLSASDIGLPLGPAGHAALVTGNVTAFAEGLDVSEDDVVLYLALREAAHQRLFAHVPWLRQHLLSSVEAYGRGMTIDVSGIESKLQGLDPTDPKGIQEALEGGLFEPQQTPAQQAALARLETTLALVEGWVDEVVGQAAGPRMPSADKLREAVRRRRAAGGPAEQTFAALVGLELRPRRLRDASTLWGSLRDRQGQDARDAVWAHPDLLPTAEDLDDPLGLPRRPRGARRAQRRRVRRSSCRPCWTRRRVRTARTTTTTARPRTRAAARRARARVTTLHADALEVLEAWVAPSRAQERLRSAYVDLLRTEPDAVLRELSSRPPDRERAGGLGRPEPGAADAARKAQRWFQFGGHLEPGDPSLADAALREAREESGLVGLSGPVGPVHLDRHAVPFCDPERRHAPPRRALPAGRPRRRRPHGQRRVAGRALVARRRPPDRRAVDPRARVSAWLKLSTRTTSRSTPGRFVRWSDGPSRSAGHERPGPPWTMGGVPVR